jgi:PAS domain S-box-containing protein
MKKINISKFSATLGARKKLEESVREQGWFSGEIMGVRKNGEKFPAILSVSISNDEKGEPTGRMGVFRDFTERKQVEEEANRCVFR